MTTIPNNPVDFPARVPTDDNVLMRMRDEVQEWCTTKGWWDDGRTFGDEISLIHSELSEALEAFREWGFADATAGETQEGANFLIQPKPEGVGSELADVLVRLLHTCGEHEIDLWAEFRRKMDYNGTRAYRHGGKGL